MINNTLKILSLVQMLEDMQQGIGLARKAVEARLRDAETQNRLSHLHRTGQTTQAYQILTNMSKNAKNQGKIMVKVRSP